MTKGLSFNDVTLVPASFTSIISRKDVSTSQVLCGNVLQMPVISSNMDSVYSPDLAKKVAEFGGMSCVHRFCSIEENVELFRSGIYKNIKPWVSVGLGDLEFQRAQELRGAGADVVLIDVANAACLAAVEQYNRLRDLFPHVVVGNFGTYDQIVQFCSRVKVIPSAIKVSIGSGSACQTRVVAGVGLPSVTTILDCKKAGIPMIFDGGISNSGDLSKAVALGCHAVMCGRIFAATEESGAHWEIVPNDYADSKASFRSTTHKVYRGSASASSYVAQGKTATFRAPEGAEFSVKVTGTVEQLMNNLSGGLRSCMSYLDSITLDKLHQTAKFIEVSAYSALESDAHGKNK